MIVVAIIGILAAIAIPAYQDYTIRSQVSEGLTLAGAAKAAVAESFSQTGNAPVNRTVAGMSAHATDTNGKYVTERRSHGRHDHDHLRQRRQQRRSAVGTLALTPYETPDASVAWRCGDATAPGWCRWPPRLQRRHDRGAAALTNIDAKYLPKACRP